MHRSHYQPKRSQQLYLVEKLREKFNQSMDRIVVHHVLEDSPTRLYLQIERQSVYDGKIYFERVEI